MRKDPNDRTQKTLSQSLLQSPPRSIPFRLADSAMAVLRSLKGLTMATMEKVDGGKDDIEEMDYEDGLRPRF